jgi:hypothetical protein
MTLEKYKCSICLYETSRKYNLNRHMMSKHNIIYYKNPTENYKNTTDNCKNPIENYKNPIENKCYKCSKILSSKYYLHKHLLICKGVLNSLECHYCHKILANSGSKCAHLKIKIKKKIII